MKSGILIQILKNLYQVILRVGQRVAGSEGLLFAVRGQILAILGIGGS